ncbi:hypothetical protein TanjilG_17202 [Lupinus angustifolius]|uniref:Exostosin GT47 domain-containing protein n=1 Tax=Lupinus angustifolius TaxID=3871 RepID=A0A4P1R1P5_LUPAN|nr:PREDICTED: probable xyloglucan galactosyltransferase GT12 [Lupinus angustifolius]OIV99392.1 hypothetical protein TanjilG_17202 [Lupinus angustifolius]
MEKSTTFKWHNKIWFVVLVLSFGWLFLHYAYFTVNADDNIFIFLGHRFATTSNFHGSSHYRLPFNKDIHFAREEPQYDRPPVTNVNTLLPEKKDENVRDHVQSLDTMVNEKRHENGRGSFENVNTIEYEKKRANGIKKHRHRHRKVLPKKNHEVENVGMFRNVSKENHFSKDNNKVDLVGAKSTAKKHEGMKNGDIVTSKHPCAGRYIYVHEIPSRFNEDMLKNCASLNKWTNMCDFTSNLGLGPVIEDSTSVFLKRGWFKTSQFLLEVIFHNRMTQYKCLTKDSTIASAIYVPYYAGLDVSRYLWFSNASMKDADSLDLVKWLREKPEWRKMWGRDHFMVAGRITWDFRRIKRDSEDWGNQLLVLPETKNMTVLVIEKSPWANNDFAIPYPTYFHPSRVDQVFSWLRKMRKQKRPYLFCFAGAPRPGREDSIRGHLFNQCRIAEKKCKLLECQVREESKCHQPAYVMEVFQSSEFCLQPPGDSYTRRSIFDSILAGCIPVFFHPGSAYIQYLWHLPKDYTTYSVFISEKDVQDGKVSIEKILSEIPKAKVRYMRAEIIKLIPSIIYTDPRFRLDAVEDAFDVTIKRVLERVDKLRKGVDSSLRVKEELTWKHSLSGIVGEQKWDSFFVKKAG